MSLNLELRWGGPRHKRIKEALLSRQRLSRRGMEDWHEDWRRSEENALMYLPEKEADVQRRLKRENFGQPQYTTIEVPMSYAMMLTAHTYWATVFLSRSPVLQYLARRGANQSNEQAVEALMDYQLMVGRWLVPLYLWLLDAPKYGLGVIGLYWDEEVRQISEIIEAPATFEGVPLIGQTRKVRRTRAVPGFKGNKIFNVRPYDFWPDTRVSLSEFQKGEFCGRTTIVGWNEILRGQESGLYFNIDVLRKMRRSRQQGREWGSSQLLLPREEETLEDPEDLKDTSPVKLLEMYVDLSPKVWGLGNTSTPEKWVFILAEDEVLIGARPYGYLHDQFPYFLLEYELEAYALAKRSMLDMLRPMNNILSWLVDSHFTNVRKVLNDMFIVDPSKVRMRDMTDPLPGKLIRVRPEAYGQDVRTMVHQFQVVDVTQGHMRDIPLVLEMMQRLVGVTDNIMGLVNPGGRKTATEVRTSSSLGINRLKTHAEYMSAMGWAPLSQAALQNTQQFWTDEDRFRVAGDLIRPQDQFVDVTPEGIVGFYDYVPVDGTLPIDRFAMANLQREILKEALSIPNIGMSLDILGLISHIAQLAGMKNFDRFRIDVQPDDVLAAQAQAGNIVPIGGPGGRRASVGGAEDSARVPEPGQVPGMGTTG